MPTFVASGKALDTFPSAKDSTIMFLHVFKVNLYCVFRTDEVLFCCGTTCPQCCTLAARVAHARLAHTTCLHVYAAAAFSCMYYNTVPSDRITSAVYVQVQCESFSGGLLLYTNRHSTLPPAVSRQHPDPPPPPSLPAPSPWNAVEGVGVAKLMRKCIGRAVQQQSPCCARRLLVVAKIHPPLLLLLLLMLSPALIRRQRQIFSSAPGRAFARCSCLWRRGTAGAAPSSRSAKQTANTSEMCVHTAGFLSLPSSGVGGPRIIAFVV